MLTKEYRDQAQDIIGPFESVKEAKAIQLRSQSIVRLPQEEGGDKIYLVSLNFVGASRRCTVYENPNGDKRVFYHWVEQVDLPPSEPDEWIIEYNMGAGE
jgi:hypothetical protein